MVCLMGVKISDIVPRRESFFRLSASMTGRRLRMKRGMLRVIFRGFFTGLLILCRLV